MPASHCACMNNEQKRRPFLLWQWASVVYVKVAWAQQANSSAAALSIVDAQWQEGRSCAFGAMPCQESHAVYMDCTALYLHAW